MFLNDLDYVNVVKFIVLKHNNNYLFLIKRQFNKR